MPQAQFSISWEEHLNNISHGLSTLQQNNEFVDMTLAADGYFVKVHQLVMAISSPYIKNLISAAQCPHPIIFLNKISHQTLKSILEYIYMGEVLISIENLNELLEAARELHIKGLEDMDITRLLSGKSQRENSKFSHRSETPTIEQFDHNVKSGSETNPEQLHDMETTHSMDIIDNELDEIDESEEPVLSKLPESAGHALPSKNKEMVNTLQYTVSNQGSLQMILNRFIYYLKYTNRDKTRQWRCVNYVNSSKCPAYVITKDDVVIQRISAHCHPFHDRRILKKIKSGSIYTALHEAETSGEKIKNKCENQRNK